MMNFRHLWWILVIFDVGYSY